MKDDPPADWAYEPRASEEERALVRHALELLSQQSPNEASVLELHYALDLSVTEIARHEHVPEQAVRRWLHRGHRRLRRIIEQLRDQEEP